MEDFAQFLERREAAARAYCAGDPGPVLDLSASAGQATFFDPDGGFTEGAAEVRETNSEGAMSFEPGGATHFELHDSGADGGLGFWTGFQLAEVNLRGVEGKVPMKIRVTEIFRNDGTGWRMIHRHASEARD